MKKMTKIAAGLFLAATLSVSLSAAMPAQASSAGRKNTTIALGAIAVHQLLKGKTTNGLIAGAVTAYAYKRYKDAKEDEDRLSRWDRARRSTSRYDRSYRRR